MSGWRYLLEPCNQHVHQIHLISRAPCHACVLSSDGGGSRSEQVGVQVIAVLVILSVINHTLTSIARTGAPCYYWWKHWATTVTFAAGHAVRLFALPHAVCGLLGARKGDARGVRLLFWCLLALAACCVLDVVLCVFEVNAVCTSQELIEWNHCAHEWGRNQYVCAGAPQYQCGVVAQAETQGETGAGATDFDACIAAVGCQHTLTLKSDWVRPSCCEDGDWPDGSGPCDGVPVERPAEFDTGFCQLVSDMYDVTLNLAWAAVLVWFAYVVNSYRIAIGEADAWPVANGASEGAGHVSSSKPREERHELEASA